MAATPDTTPYWSDSATFPRFGKLDGDASADVVVVGAGITGLTVAYSLARAGPSVMVLERARCASVDTGHTSAHLTMVTDSRFHELVKQLGRPHAQAVWDAGLCAIATIDEIVREHEIDCGFDWVEGYLHLPRGESGRTGAETLKQDAEAAGELGFDATFVSDVPIMGTPGVRFDGQARVHPRRYLAGLAHALVAAGGKIHEHTDVTEFSSEPLSVTANGHRVTCGDIALATHNPLVGVAGMTSAPCSRPSSRSTPATSSRGARRAARCPMLCGGTRRIPTAICGSSRTAVTTW
jgi:glycine/D-amino acid oxidase-like deaminating enzyme